MTVGFIKLLQKCFAAYVPKDSLRISIEPSRSPRGLMEALI